MSERLPYEEQLPQQWHDLPLPDENSAWADMKRRLDDDDDDGVVIPWWRRGCAVWGLLLLVLLALGWWWFEPHKWASRRPGSNVSVDTAQAPELRPVNGNRGSSATPGTDRRSSNDSSSLPAIRNSDTQGTAPTGQPVSDSPATNTEITKPSVTTNSETEITVTPGGKTTRRKNTAGTRPPARQTGSLPRVTSNNNQPVISSNVDKQRPVDEGKPVSSAEKNKRDDIPAITADEKKSDTNAVAENKRPDSTTTKPPVTSNLQDSTNSKNAKQKKEKERKPYFFSGGIALQQQIPIAGQTTSPYNAVGRKGSLRDYIPSIYLRYNKKDRWFFQGEFRYGAPQYTKNLTFDEVAVLDTAGGINFTVITSQRVLKTYYHQLPLTFQHYILPGWSLGGGVVWNKFYGAITEQQVNRRDNATQNDTVVDYKVVLDKSDSSGVFSKSYFQGVVETQYQWKRFSLGARYAFGLQPYMRFTLPGAVRREEKNSSLQIFLRYQLWKSKEK